MIDNKKIFSEILEKIKNTPSEKRIILSHISNDGLTSSFILYSLFGKSEIEFSKTITNKLIEVDEEKEVVLICGLKIIKSQINEILEKNPNCFIIDFSNFGSQINRKNYVYIDSKKNFKKNFMSSTNKIYEIFNQDECFKEILEKNLWVLGIGAIIDFCCEKDFALFEIIKQKYPELLDKENIFESKIFEISQIFLESQNPKEIFSLLEEISKNNLSYHELYKSQIFLDWVKKNDFISQLVSTKKIPIKETKNFVFINSSGKNYPGAYANFLNLHYKDERAYIEYNHKKIFFTNYYGWLNDKMIQNFENCAGNSKIAEAWTQESFEGIIKLIVGSFENKNTQTKLF